MGIFSGGGHGILKGRGKQNKLVAGSRLGRSAARVLTGERSGLQKGLRPKKTLKSIGRINRGGYR